MRALGLLLLLACGGEVNLKNLVATDRTCGCPELGHVVDGFMCAPPDGLPWPEPSECQECVDGRCCYWRPL